MNDFKLTVCYKQSLTRCAGAPFTQGSLLLILCCAGAPFTQGSLFTYFMLRGSPFAQGSFFIFALRDMPQERYKPLVTRGPFYLRSFYTTAKLRRSSTCRSCAADFCSRAFSSSFRGISKICFTPPFPTTQGTLRYTSSIPY